MKKIYILLTDTGTLFTRTIKLYTRKPYNHVSISFNQELSSVYSFGRKRPRNPFIGGFVQEELEGDLFKFANCAIYSCQVTDQQYNNMLEHIQTIDAEKDRYRYNLIGTLAIPLKLNIHRDYAFFCSQFVATILHAGGIHIEDKPLNFITPHDIQQYADLILEYEGCLNGYPQLQGDTSFAPECFISI